MASSRPPPTTAWAIRRFPGVKLVMVIFLLDCRKVVSGRRDRPGLSLGAQRLRIQRGSRQSMNLHGIFAGGGAEGGAVSSPLLKPKASRQPANATQAATRSADAKPAP